MRQLNYAEIAKLAYQRAEQNIFRRCSQISDALYENWSIRYVKPATIFARTKVPLALVVREIWKKSL